VTLLETLCKVVVAAALVVVAAIHLLPLSGALGSARLAALYGLAFDEPNLVILMRHRAILFGLLGLFLLYAAFRPPLQGLAFVAGFVSVCSFLWLARGTAQVNPQVAAVVVADTVALGCLLTGAAAYLLLRHLRD
jgi:hypothetical protein